MSSAISLFFFTVRQLFRDRKILLAVVLLAAPSVLVLVVRFVPEEGEGPSAWERYHAIVNFLMLNGVVPLTCLLYGPGIIATEADAGTLVYLLTRRMRRATVFLVRFAATASVLTVLLVAALSANYVCAVGGTDPSSVKGAPPEWRPIADLFNYLAVTSVAATAFLAVFAAISLLTARSLVASGLYVIVVEVMMANVPVGARVVSVTHLVRKTLVGLMPYLRNVYDLPSDLAEKIYPSGSTGWYGLVVLIASLLILGCVLATRRELVPARLARG